MRKMFAKITIGVAFIMGISGNCPAADENIFTLGDISKEECIRANGTVRTWDYSHKARGWIIGIILRKLIFDDYGDFRGTFRLVNCGIRTKKTNEGSSAGCFCDGELISKVRLN